MNLPVRRLWILPVLFAVAGCACLFIDYPVARWCYDHNPEIQRLLEHSQPREGEDSPKQRHSPLHAFQKLFDFAEIYADGVGVIILLLTLFVVDAGKRRQFPRLIAASLGAGIVTDIFKILIVRARPKSYFRFSDASGIWDTFQFDAPWALHFKSAWQSMPSGHATTAMGFTIVLIWMYPRGRWLFPIFAVLASVQRVLSSYHFPSDVCFGAMVGSTVAFCCLNGPLARWFDRFERRGETLTV